MNFFPVILSLTSALLISPLIKGQPDTIPVEIKKYKAKLVTTSGKKHIGMIIHMRNDSLILGPSWKPFHYSEIQSIQLQKKGHTAKKMITWGTIATAAGGLAGVIGFNDPITRSLGTSGGEIFAVSGGIAMPFGVGTGYLISRKGKYKYFVGADQRKWSLTREHFFHNAREENAKHKNNSVTK